MTKILIFLQEERKDIMSQAEKLINEIRQFHMDLDEHTFNKEIEKLVYTRSRLLDENSLKILRVELKRVHDKKLSLVASTAKSRLEPPGAAERCREPPRAAESPLRAAKSHRQPPTAADSRQEPPRAAESRQEPPRAAEQEP